MSKDVVIGIDEAGMGPGAGPVTAAVVVLPADVLIMGVKDSKKLSEERREELVDAIHQAALFFKADAYEPAMIDRWGISTCWQELICWLARQAHKRFPRAEIILDGNRLVGLSYVRPVVKADDKYLVVGAASILAKYTQCLWMEDYHQQYPIYGFDQHKGYFTALHKSRLEKYGPCPAHRRSYKPIKRLIEGRSLSSGSRRG